MNDEVAYMGLQTDVGIENGTIGKGAHVALWRATNTEVASQCWSSLQYRRSTRKRSVYALFVDRRNCIANESMAG